MIELHHSPSTKHFCCHGDARYLPDILLLSVTMMHVLERLVPRCVHSVVGKRHVKHRGFDGDLMIWFSGG